MTGLSYCKIIVDLKSLISDLYNINDRLAQLLSDISKGKLLPCSPSENYSDLMFKKDVEVCPNEKSKGHKIWHKSQGPDQASQRCLGLRWKLWTVITPEKQSEC